MLKLQKVLFEYPPKCLTAVNPPLISITSLFPPPLSNPWQQQLAVSSRLRQNLSILNILPSRLMTHDVHSLLCVCLLSLGLVFQVRLA